MRFKSIDEFVSEGDAPAEDPLSFESMAKLASRDFKAFLDTVARRVGLDRLDDTMAAALGMPLEAARSVIASRGVDLPEVRKEEAAKRIADQIAREERESLEKRTRAGNESAAREYERLGAAAKAAENGRWPGFEGLFGIRNPALLAAAVTDGLLSGALVDDMRARGSISEEAAAEAREDAAGIGRRSREQDEEWCRQAVAAGVPEGAVHNNKSKINRIAWADQETKSLEKLALAATNEKDRALIMKAVEEKKRDMKVRLEEIRAENPVLANIIERNMLGRGHDRDSGGYGELASAFEKKSKTAMTTASGESYAAAAFAAKILRRSETDPDGAAAELAAAMARDPEKKAALISSLSSAYGDAKSLGDPEAKRTIAELAAFAFQNGMITKDDVKSGKPLSSDRFGTVDATKTLFIPDGTGAATAAAILTGHTRSEFGSGAPDPRDIKSRESLLESQREIVKQFLTKNAQYEARGEKIPRNDPVAFAVVCAGLLVSVNMNTSSGYLTDKAMAEQLKPFFADKKNLQMIREAVAAIRDGRDFGFELEDKEGKRHVTSPQAKAVISTMCAYALENGLVPVDVVSSKTTVFTSPVGTCGPNDPLPGEATAIEKPDVAGKLGSRRPAQPARTPSGHAPA